MSILLNLQHVLCDHNSHVSPNIESRTQSSLQTLHGNSDFTILSNVNRNTFITICVNSYKYKNIIKNQSEYDYDPIELAGTNYIILKLKIIDLTPDTCFIGQLTNKHPTFEQGDKYMLAAAISSVKLRKVSDITG